MEQNIFDIFLNENIKKLSKEDSLVFI